MSKLHVFLSFVLAVGLAEAADVAPRVVTVGPGAACATIESALDRVAEIRKGDRTTPLVVEIAPGNYTPARALAVTRKHAATNWAPLVVRAADRARRPRIHGGRAVTGWTRTAFNGHGDVWSADVSSLALKPRHKLFFFNGRRMQPARWPNADPAHPFTRGFAFAQNDGKSMWTPPRFAPTGYYEDEFSFRPGEERRWAHPEDGWVVAWPRHNWWNRALGLKSVSNGVVRLVAPHKELDDRLFPWDRWYVENVAEELDAPGEWYFDPRAKRIFFIPPNGEDPNAGTCTVARGEPILTLAGGNCTVIGLELTGGSSGVRVDHADHVTVLGFDIHDIGFHDGSGVWIMGHHVRLADCDISRIGGHGVFVQSFPKETRVDDRLDVVVENNYLHHCGEVNSHGIGIWIGGQGVRVSHNLLHDMPRCGLFGYGRFCEISYNRVRHVNLSNDDTGALYGGGWIGGIGSKVCFNHFSDSIGFQRQSDGTYRFNHGACGVYPDEGCGGLEVYGNLIEHCHHVAMHLHNGRWITISNNVFVSNGALPVGRDTRQLSLQTWDNNPNGYFVKIRRAAISNEYHRLVDADPRWRAFPALAQAPDDATAFADDGTTLMGNRVVNNIVSYPDQGQGVMLSGWKLNTTTNFFDRNVYWPGQTTNVAMRAGQKGGDGWAAWRATGEDAHSVIADPLFRDGARGDWRLRPESPAFRLGFVELPYAQMGLQKSAYRPQLPAEAEGAREHPEWLVDQPRSEVVRTGDWRLRVDGCELAVTPAALVTVKGEKLGPLPEKPQGGWRCGGWQRGKRLAALIAYECSVQGALLPETLVVKRADGTALVEGRDYEVEKAWGCVARLAGGAIGATETVTVDYTYRPQRLDRIVRTADGKILLRPGVAKASNPVLPASAAGEVTRATVWLDGRTVKLEARNVYPVYEQAYPRPPAQNPCVAARLLPKTWAKLAKGEPLTVLAWGDSVTNGGYLPEADRWQGQFIARLRAQFPKSAIRLVSNGWGGRNSATFLDVKAAPPGHPFNYEETVLGANADLVVMEFVNDAGLVDYAALKARYDRILRDLKGRGAELCVLTPHYVRADWMGLADPTATTEDPRPYVKNVRRWTAASGVALADASLRWGRFARQGIPYQTLLVNEINHPNKQGMATFADALMDLFHTTP